MTRQISNFDSKFICIDYFYVKPLKVVLSFNKHSVTRTKIDSKLLVINIIAKAIGIVLTNIDEAPLNI